MANLYVKQQEHDAAIAAQAISDYLEKNANCYEDWHLKVFNEGFEQGKEVGNAQARKEGYAEGAAHARCPHLVERCKKTDCISPEDIEKCQRYDCNAYCKFTEKEAKEIATAERERIAAKLERMKWDQSGWKNEDSYNGARAAYQRVIDLLRSQPERRHCVPKSVCKPGCVTEKRESVTKSQTEPECGACTGPDPLDVLEVPARASRLLYLLENTGDPISQTVMR